MKFKQFLSKFSRNSPVKFYSPIEADVQLDNKTWMVEGFRNLRTDNWSEDVSIQEEGTQRSPTKAQREKIKKFVLDNWTFKL